MEREVEYLQLPHRRERCGKPYKAPLHHGVLQYFIFTVEKGLCILTAFKRDRSAPYKRFVLVLRTRERIAKALYRIGVSENKVYGEPDLKTLDRIIKPRTKDLCKLLDLPFIPLDDRLCIYGQYKAVQRPIRAVLSDRLEQGRPLFAINPFGLVASGGIYKNGVACHAPVNSGGRTDISLFRLSLAWKRLEIEIRADHERALAGFRSAGNYVPGQRINRITPSEVRRPEKLDRFLGTAR